MNSSLIYWQQSSNFSAQSNLWMNKKNLKEAKLYKKKCKCLNARGFFILTKHYDVNSITFY